MQPEEIIEGFKKVNVGFVSSYGKTPDWQSVITAMDSNNDGKIDYGEFLTAATNRVNLLSNQNLRATFSVLDANGDGRITEKEFVSACLRHSRFSDLLTGEIIKMF